MFHLWIRLFITAEKILSPVRCSQSDWSEERHCHLHYPIIGWIVNGNILLLMWQRHKLSAPKYDIEHITVQQFYSCFCSPSVFTRLNFCCFRASGGFTRAYAPAMQHSFVRTRRSVLYEFWAVCEQMLFSINPHWSFSVIARLIRYVVLYKNSLHIYLIEK